MTRKLSTSEVLEIAAVIVQLKNMPKNPLKFCMARNGKLLDEVTNKFTASRDSLFNEAAKLNEEGLPVILEKYKDVASKLIEAQQSVPFAMYEFNDGSGESFLKDIEALLLVENEIELATESLSRKIKVSSEKGYVDCTLEEVLEDPSNDINVDTLSLFMKYFLVD